MGETQTTIPYKGLIPYSVEDALFFFGREPEREVIAANLMASRLTVLYGESGVGKTSVLNAGVLYHLRALMRRDLDERGQSEFAVAIFSSWRDDPVAGLANCVHTSVEQLLGARVDPLGPPPDGLLDMLQATSMRLGCQLLLILDQFEEYFLYHGHQDGGGKFGREFTRLMNSSADINVLVSIREDALAKLDLFKGRIPRLFDNYLRVDHLGRDAARLAITGPLDEFNRLLPLPGHRVSIEPSLVDAVLDQIPGGQLAGAMGRLGVPSASGDGRVEAPLLQLVMSRLWDEEIQTGSHTLRLETLTKRLGGAERIIRTHLDEAIGALTPKEQDIAADVFHFLVTPSGSKIAHTVADLAQYTRKAETQLAPVLAKLSHGNIRVLRPVVSRHSG